MTRVVHSVFGQGYSPTAPTEYQYLSSTIAGWRGDLPTCIYFHGYGASALTAVQEPQQAALFADLAQNYSLIVADLGLNAFGNDTHVERAVEALIWLEDRMHASGPVTLVAGSMGVLGAMGLAKLAQDTGTPELIQAVVGIVPALDIADVAKRGYDGPIDAAYGGAYDDAVHGPDHSPIQYARDLLPGTPMKLWISSNDPTTVPNTAYAFAQQRPETDLEVIGAYGHGGIAAATDSVMSWLATTR